MTITKGRAGFHKAAYNNPMAFATIPEDSRRKERKKKKKQKPSLFKQNRGCRLDKPEENEAVEAAKSTPKKRRRLEKRRERKKDRGQLVICK